MNGAIAKLLSELSVLMELRRVAFKPRAFQRAADAIAALGVDVADVYRDGGLTALERIPGVGPGIAKRIEEYVLHGHIHEYDRMKRAFPVDVLGIMAVEGIGPKTIQLLYRKLNIRTLAQLTRAAKSGKLRSIRGIGERGQANILRGLDYLSTSSGRVIPGVVWPTIRAIIDRLESVRGVRTLEVCGSLRRMEETIGDLDFVVVSSDGEQVLREFVSLPQVQSVQRHGDQRAFVRLVNGVDADLTVTTADAWGAALIGWTGSRAHNIHLRTLARKKHLLLDDYGLFRGTHMIAGRTEAEIYRALGLQFIPPELRSDTGEIEAAAKHALPRLVEYADVRGDLHVHTDWSDGAHSILKMARAAETAGLAYIAITDHSASLTIAHGLDAKQLRRQWTEIDRVQKIVPNVRLLKGCECDIRKDGSLDVDDAVLAQLDVVGVSVHSHFNLEQREQTNRVVRAMEHPRTHILFHPTGRLVERRPPYDVDMTEILKVAKKTKTVLEVNAAPERLDMNGDHVRMAVQAGVRLAINSDGHDVAHLGVLRWGIGQARRGWATSHDVINTRSCAQMLRILK